MAVAFVAGRFFAELDRLLRAPLDAGEALFAVMTPDGLSSAGRSMFPQGQSLADAAAVALLIDPETLVHLGTGGRRAG